MLLRPDLREWTIREAAADDGARLAWIRTASWRDAYRDIIPPLALERIAGRDAQRMAHAVRHRGRGHTIWLAEDRQHTAFGYAWAGPQTDRALPFLGEVFELYLHPAWQRARAGTALLTHTIWALLAARLHPVALWVLADNHPARRFYETMGAVEVARRAVDVGGRPLEKIAYGWHEQLPLPNLRR
jgi:GNAT superfamily N-acetyltransferase